MARSTPSWWLGFVCSICSLSKACRMAAAIHVIHFLHLNSVGCSGRHRCLHGVCGHGTLPGPRKCTWKCTCTPGRCHSTRCALNALEGCFYRPDSDSVATLKMFKLMSVTHQPHKKASLRLRPPPARLQRLALLLRRWPASPWQQEAASSAPERPRQEQELRFNLLLWLTFGIGFRV